MADQLYNLASMTTILQRFTDLAYSNAFARNEGGWDSLTHTETRNHKTRDEIRATDWAGTTGLTATGTDDLAVLTPPTVSEAEGFMPRYGGALRIPLATLHGLAVGAAKSLVPDDAMANADLASQLMAELGEAGEYLVAELTGAAEKIQSDLIGDTFGTGGTGLSSDTAVIGINNWISETATVNGINKTSDASYRPYNNDNTGSPRALTKVLVDDVYSTMRLTRKGNPTAWWMSFTQWLKWQAAADTPTSQIQIQAQPIRDALSQGLSFNVGALGGVINNLPVKIMPDFPTGIIVLVDERKYFVRHYRHSNFGPKISVLQSQNDQARIDMIWQGQTQMVNPWKNIAVLSDLATS